MTFEPGKSYPCYCANPFSGQGTVSVGGGSTITFPTRDSNIIANRQIQVKWNNSDADIQNADSLSLALHIYSGTCAEDFKPPFASISCRYSNVLQEALVKVDIKKGEAPWTPSANLTSRNDYMLTGCLWSQKEKSCAVLGTAGFTILQKEGEEPLKLPTEEDIRDGLIGRSTRTSSTTWTRTTLGPTGYKTGLGNVGVTTTTMSTNTPTQRSTAPLGKVQKTPWIISLWLILWFVYALRSGA